jgi:Uma2 family endonuclease
MGWFIDPAERSVFVYWTDRSTQVFYEEIDILPVPKFAKNFQIALSELFGWLRD